MINFLNLFDRDDKYRLLVLLFLFIISGFIEVIGIASIAPFIALFKSPEIVTSNSLYIEFIRLFNLSAYDATLIIGVMIILLFTLSNFLSAYVLWRSVRFTALQQHKISMKVIEKYLYQPYDFYLKNNASFLSKNILHETGVVCDLVILPALQFFSKIIIVVSVSIFLLTVNHHIFLTTVLILGLVYFYIYKTIKNKIKNYGNKKIIMNKEKYKYVTDAFSDIKNVKFYEVEKSFLKKLDNPTREFSFLTAKSTLMSVLPKYILEIIIFGGIFAVGLYYFSQNYNIYDESPIIGVFIIAAYRILPLIQHIYQNYTSLVFNSPATGIIKQIYNLQESRCEKKVSTSFQNRLEVKNIRFYHDKKIILDNVNMSIEKSKVIGLTGGSGQGKTTIIDILLGFHTKFDGEIFLDNNLLFPSDIINMRSMTGYVSQDMHLTSMSYKENIAYGVHPSEINLNLISELTKIVELEDLVDNLEYKMDTILSDNAMNISGGQKQRILLARSLYRKPELLFLDESTNALNEDLEHRVLSNIKKFFPAITILLVSHRTSIHSFCDKVYELTNKKIQRKK